MCTPKPVDWTSNLTPYADAAAGHEGLSSNASGSLIIKPCTQAEIDFYESSKQHPEFQAHMPTYMGNLTLSQEGTVQAPGSVLEDHDNVIAPLPSMDATSSTTNANKGDAKPWVPSGGKKISTGLAIVLENATTSFKRPNVLDLKLGSRLWANYAPEAKRQKLDQVAGETTSGSLGFRVAGMKLWMAGSSENKDMKEVNTQVKEGYKNFDKMYGRTLDKSNVKDAFTRFLGGRKQNNTSDNTNSEGVDDNKVKFQRPKTKVLLQRFLRELESVQYVLEHEESRMYSASILVVAEGDDDALEEALSEEPKFLQRQQQRQQDEEDEIEDETGISASGSIINNENLDDTNIGNDGDVDDDDDDEEEMGPRILEVRLIDFAHAEWVPGQGPDENALKGVRNIRKIVEDLLHDAA